MTGINYDNYSIFSQALSEVFAEDASAEMEEYRINHEFSTEFEKKMRKLIRRQKKPYYDLISTAGRRAACVLAALLIAGSTALSVDAVREIVINFIVEHFSDHDEFNTDTGPIEYPRTIEREYEINVPEGFVLEKDISVSTPTYLTRSYKSENNYIAFFQYTVYEFYSKVNNQESKVEYYTDKNGILYTIYYWDEAEGNCDVIWQKDNYIFQLNSDLSKQEVIDLCVNIKLKKQNRD